MLIDTHSHLDTFVKNNSIDEILENANEHKVEKIITCSTNESDWNIYEELSKKYPEKIYWTIGVHPTEITEHSIDCLDALCSYFTSDSKPIAIGEIGLDYFHLPKDKIIAEQEVALQKIVLKKQLGFAKDLDMSVCIHARSAFKDTLEILLNEKFDMSKVVFHCFSEGIDEVKYLNELGARASFTGIITYPKAQQMRDAMLAQGLNKLMFETDCPYLAPQNLRGKQNQPANISYIAKKASELFAIDEAEIADITTNNSLEFFNIK